MRLTVNLAEFSDMCAVTEVTMRKYVGAVEGNPDWLIARGRKGFDYEIDPVAGMAWWKAKLDDDERVSEERKAQLRQLRFDLLSGAAEEEQLGLSGRQRRDEFAAEFERLRLAKEMKALVEIGKLAPLLIGAAVEARRRLQLIPGEFAATTGLSPEEVQPLYGLIERALAEFVETWSGVAAGETPC